VAGGLAVAPANMIGAAVAVSFVYVTAQRHIFRRKPGRLTALQRGLAYGVYQALAIAAASALIGMLAWTLQAMVPGVAMPVVAGLSKIAITPLTLYSNFVFMGWLLEGRVAWR
jgi:putative flippase GtrA